MKDRILDVEEDSVKKVLIAGERCDDEKAKRYLAQLADARLIL